MNQISDHIQRIIQTFLIDQSVSLANLGFLPLLMMTSASTKDSVKNTSVKELISSYLTLLDNVITSTDGTAKIEDSSIRKRFDSFASSMDSSGFRTAPSTPLQAHDDQILNLSSTPRAESLSKKKLFPDTPQRIPSSPVSPTKDTASESMENLKFLILFTSLLLAALKSSDDPGFLVDGYSLLFEQISRQPVVVKCLYGAIFPELIKKSSSVRQKDRIVLSVIQKGTMNI